VVDFYLPVTVFLLVASPSQGASITSPGSVDDAFRPVSAVGLALSYPDTFHVLPHWTDEVVPIRVVVQVLYTEDILLECLFLLLVEEVVLDVCLYAVRFHEGVVLLASISGVRTSLLGVVTVPVGEGGKEGYHGERVRRIGEEAEVGDELALGSYLQVVPRLGLSVVHGVLLHAHKRCIRVGLAVGGAFAQRFQVLIILSQFVCLLLQILCLLLPFLVLLFLLLSGAH